MAGELLKSVKGGALAVPEDLRGGLVVEGGDSGSKLGRMALYQGTSQEQATYGEGKFKRGDFLDVMEQRKLASSKIVPVFATVVYQNWPKDSKTPLYTFSHEQRHLIPRADLEWDGDRPPVATKIYNVVVLVEGEPWPYLLAFKKTAVRCFEQIQAFESRRAATNRGYGLYELYSEDEKNPAGNTYRKLKVRPPVDLPESMHELARSVIAGLAAMRAKAAEMAASDGGDTPREDHDDIPI